MFVFPSGLVDPLGFALGVVIHVDQLLGSSEIDPRADVLVDDISLSLTACEGYDVH